MNKFIKDFFESKFDGYSPIKQISKENFWMNSIIPFVELKLNLNVNETYEWCLENSDLFYKNNTQDYAIRRQKELDTFWFSESHSAGWFNLRLMKSELKRNEIVKHGAQPGEQDEDTVYDKVTAIEHELTNKSFKLKSLQIMKLSKNGWVQPHIDSLLMGATRMEYFWIPLNSTDPSVKIYPYGFLKPNLGSVYFFNNSSFVHAVANLSGTDRYVAIGRIDVERTSEGLTKLVLENAINQWY